jgi:signal peptide peptidase-like 2B
MIQIACMSIELVCRRAAWAWVLQNILGMCFMTFVLQTVTLPSIRVASVFLIALFVYDVFMVFITPLFMPRGDSVMVRVATGGDMHEV